MAAPSATEGRRTGPRPGRLKLEGIALSASLGYLALADPHDPAVAMPRCPIKSASGWDCPSCGGLRVVHDVLHADLRQALADNLLLVVLSPLLLYLLYRHARSLQTGERYHVHKKVAWGLLATAILWGVVRNLPAWPLKPAPR